MTDTAEWMGLVTWLAATLMKRPYILRLRGDAVAELSQQNKKMHLFFFTKKFAPGAAFIIPVSNYLAENLKRQCNLLESSKIVVIPTPQHSIPDYEPSFHSTKPILLIVTSFRLKAKVNKLFEMLHIFDRLLSANKDMKIHILGSGPLLDKFAQNVQKLKHSERIDLKGYVREVRSEYINSRALLHVSELDAYPSVVNEARAYGVPVIASNNVGMKEQINDGFDGIILDEPLDSLLLSWDKLQDVHYWEYLSKNGRQRIVHENAPEIIGKKILGCISLTLESSYN